MPRVIVERSLKARMRDGVELSADVYRPESSGRFSTIVVRVPYDKARFGADEARGYGHFFARHGFLVVIQDVRGRFESEGDFVPLVSEQLDGYDTVEWAASLPWANGRVGTAGQSYYAATQYLLAPSRPAHLIASAPISAPSDWSESWVYRTGGVLELGWLLPYAVIGLGLGESRRRGKVELMRSLASEFGLDPDDFLRGPGLVPLTDAAYRRLPVARWGDELEEIAPYLRDYFNHVEDAEYWEKLSIRRRYGEIQTPMYHIGSWYDLFLEGTLANYGGVQDHGAAGAQGRQKLLIGPWVHRPLADPYTRPSSKAGDADFGEQAAVDLLPELLRWFQYWLNGDATGIVDEPSVKVYVMGADRWRHADTWPPRETTYRRLYLRAERALSWTPPVEEPPDAYVYDPQSPTPALGGSTLAVENGPHDQRPLERRSDVLVYTSEVLNHPLEITGPLSAVLYAATSCVDTDFVVRLVDVFPDGYARNIQDGIIRGRYRAGRFAPSLLEPGRPYEFYVDLWATSYFFRAGHRIRIDIASASFPRFDRNLNVSGHPLWATQGVVATQTVFHDAERPSHVLLPVIAGARKP